MQASVGSKLPAGVTVFERGWLSSNNVLIEGSGACALVDSGYSTHSGQTLALVRQALNGRPLDVLVNTHLHSDHCGGNAALQQAYPNLQTLIPPGQADHVRDWNPAALSYVPTGQHCPRFYLTDVVKHGSSLPLGNFTWEVHAAPGHDPHAVVLFEPRSKTLLSADALWQNGFGVVFPELEGDSAFGAVAATIDLIETLSPDLVIPGHGALFDDVAAALARARRRLDAFVQNPAKHAAHAAKVLLKFKLLEQQRMPKQIFFDWVVRTHYFKIVHTRFFVNLPFEVWIEGLIQDLIMQGALAASATDLVNA